MDWWSLAITDPNPIVLIVLEVRASSCGYSAFEFQFCRSRSRYLIFNCLCHWPGKKQEIVLRSLELGVCLMQLFQFWSHMTFIQFKTCCCVQNFMKIWWFFAEICRYTNFQNGGRPPSWNCFTTIRDWPTTKSLLLAAAACQISCQSDTQIWRYSRYIEICWRY